AGPTGDPAGYEELTPVARWDAGEEALCPELAEQAAASRDTMTTAAGSVRRARLRAGLLTPLRHQAPGRTRPRCRTGLLRRHRNPAGWRTRYRCRERNAPRMPAETRTHSPGCKRTCARRPSASPQPCPRARCDR